MNRKQRRAEAKQQISGGQVFKGIPSIAAQRAFAEAIQLHQADRFAEAIRAYRRSLNLFPSWPEAHQNLGSALSSLGDVDEAMKSFQEAIAQKPDYAMAHLNLGNALWAKGRSREACNSYRRAIAIKPDFHEAHTFLAIVLGEEGAWEEGMALVSQALALQPGSAEAHNTLGNLHRSLGRLSEAVNSYRRAIELAPHYPDAHFNLAMALLALGELEAAWPEYEWRWRTPQMIAAVRPFPQQQWCGEPMKGKTLLIHAEQGQGDVLQFCRYVPMIAAQGVRVVLEVPSSLLRLCKSLADVSEFVARGQPLPPFDLHVPLMSLPGILGTRLETIPRHVPYLAADPAAVAGWQVRLAALPGLRVGLAWAGNPSPHLPSRAAMDRRRSIAPERLAPLWEVHGVSFISLQKDGPKLPENFPIFDAMDEMMDFADTAALVSSLYLVIAVDSAVAHLAGALGRPVWLLDRSDPCWRWPIGRRVSPWYPDLHIYRQAAPGEWEAVLAEVSHDLRLLVIQGSSV